MPTTHMAGLVRSSAHVGARPSFFTFSRTTALATLHPRVGFAQVLARREARFAPS